MICQEVISHVLCENLQFHDAQTLLFYKSNSSLVFLTNIFCMKTEWLRGHNLKEFFKDKFSPHLLALLSSLSTGR